MVAGAVKSSWIPLLRSEPNWSRPVIYKHLTPHGVKTVNCSQERHSNRSVEITLCYGSLLKARTTTRVLALSPFRADTILNLFLRSLSNVQLVSLAAGNVSGST